MRKHYLMKTKHEVEDEKTGLPSSEGTGEASRRFSTLLNSLSYFNFSTLVKPHKYPLLGYLQTSIKVAKLQREICWPPWSFYKFSKHPHHFLLHTSFNDNSVYEFLLQLKINTLFLMPWQLGLYTLMKLKCMAKLRNKNKDGDIFQNLPIEIHGQ